MAGSLSFESLTLNNCLLLPLVSDCSLRIDCNRKGIRMLRLAKILLVVVVAFWGYLGAMGNLLDWNQALGAVSAVTSMSGFEGGAEDWRATTNTLLSWLGALFIMLSKVTVGVCCSIGAYRMWLARKNDPAAFFAAKEIALVGCAVGIVMLYGGFMIIAESWFELWRDVGPIRMALSDAFRYAVMIALVAIFVSLPEEKSS